MNEILDNYLFEAFSNASDSIFVYVTDVKEDITRWSKNAVRFFNLESEYTTNTAELWLEYIHPDDREIYYDDISEIFLGNSAHHNCQYRVKNRYGEYIWVECKGSISLDENGELAVFAGIMTWLDNQNKYDNLTHLLTSYELLRYPFEEPGALMLIGIDRFRDINSQHGIMYGNRVLVKLAKILENEAHNCSVYRFQGDEFVVCGLGMGSQDMAAIFKRIQKASNAFDLEDGLSSFSISAGITEFAQTDTVPDVLSKAALILNHAKETSSSHMALYSTAVRQKQMRRNMISEELLYCIKNDFQDFYLVYQPLFDNSGENVIGCEALLRWNPSNQEIGECGPSEFVPILERNGGINDVGFFVVEQVMKQAALWQKKYKDFRVSFNISYLQLEDPKLVPYIVQALEYYRVNPSQIMVELTESVYASDTLMVNQSFDVLRKHGIKIALDDFGTGSSSFWTLHNIYVDVVKLDQAFIRGLADDKSGIDYAIIESTALMCKRIGFTTIAEGIETPDIWEKIRPFGFNGLQGFLFSTPVEVDAFEQLLDSRNMLK